MIKKLLLFIIIAMLICSVAIYFFVFRGLNTTIKEKINTGTPLVLYFSADWCGSCKKQKPILDSVLKEYSDLAFINVGSDLNRIEKKLLFEKYEVRGIPTFILYKNAKESHRLHGVQSKEALEEAFSSLDQKASL